MITTTIELDFTSSRSAGRDSHLLASMPDSCHVLVRVGNKTPWDLGDGRIVHWLREYVLTHHIDVHGTPRAVESWSKALRGES